MNELTVINKAIKTAYEKQAKHIDRLLMESIINSKILQFQITKIPNRKTLYWLTIKTNAKPLTIQQNGQTIIHNTSLVKVKIKL